MPVIITKDKREASAKKTIQYTFLAGDKLKNDFIVIAHSRDDEPQRMYRMIQLVDYLLYNSFDLLQKIHYLQDHKGNLFVIIKSNVPKSACMMIANNLQKIWEQELNESFVEVYIP